MPEFRFGFKDKADTLGAEIVGDPVDDERAIPVAEGKNITLQVTTKGLMVYTEGGVPLFLASR